MNNHTGYSHSILIYVTRDDYIKLYDLYIDELVIFNMFTITSITNYDPLNSPTTPPLSSLTPPLSHSTDPTSIALTRSTRIA